MIISTETSLLRHLYQNNPTIRNLTHFSQLNCNTLKRIKDGGTIFKSTVSKVADQLMAYPHILEKYNLPKDRDTLIKTLSVEP